ncbi:MAG: hypothetical protein ACLGIK_06390, partial [Gemmatimonadota bacterium]
VWEFVKANLNPYPTAAFTAAVSGDSSRPIIRPDVIIRDVVEDQRSRMAAAASGGVPLMAMRT